MKAIDTNVLVRFLMRDDEKQSEIVYRLFKKSETANEALFVPFAVVLETVWVLESVYNVPRLDILEAIDALILMPVLEFEAPSAIMNFLSAARRSQTDLSDLLIAHSAMSSGCECVLTFDKKASDSDSFELLT